jgi:hypothetical protein
VPNPGRSLPRTFDQSGPKLGFFTDDFLHPASEESASSRINRRHLVQNACGARGWTSLVSEMTPKSRANNNWQSGVSESGRKVRVAKRLRRPARVANSPLISFSGLGSWFIVLASRPGRSTDPAVGYARRVLTEGDRAAPSAARSWLVPNHEACPRPRYPETLEELCDHNGWLWSSTI